MAKTGYYPPLRHRCGGISEGTYRDRPGNADTIALIRPCPSTGKVAVLSISRDTLVEIPGWPREDRIGHAYAHGGADLLVDTVEHFTGGYPLIIISV